MLYRLVTTRPKAYAVRTGTFQDLPLIAWVPRKSSAALFRKADALKLARRMRKVARVKLEAA